MTVAIAIYKQLYCRYLAFGEAIVHDRGPEFCNAVSRELHSAFNVEVRIISAARPQANGLVENKVGTFKERARALMADGDGELPLDWDQTFFHKVMCILRTDPSSATGYAPGHLLLGRPLVYPIEMTNVQVDFSGTNFTIELVQALNKIHNDLFGAAGQKIKEYNAAYVRRLQRKQNPEGKTKLKIGDLVQLLRKKKNSLELQWVPYTSIFSIYKQKYF